MIYWLSIVIYLWFVNDLLNICVLNYWRLSINDIWLYLVIYWWSMYDIWVSMVIYWWSINDRFIIFGDLLISINDLLVIYDGLFMIYGDLLMIYQWSIDALWWSLMICYDLLMYNIGILHVFHALTFVGSRGSCLNTRSSGGVFTNISQGTRQVLM